MQILKASSLKEKQILPTPCIVISDIPLHLSWLVEGYLLSTGCKCARRRTEYAMIDKFGPYLITLAKQADLPNIDVVFVDTIEVDCVVMFGGERNSILFGEQ